MALVVKQISADFSVTGQITTGDMAEIARSGFKTVINNRPDHEGGGDQPESAMLEAAAKSVGLNYAYIPVIPNHIEPEQVAVFRACFASAEKPVLAFCRTGNRASNLYQLGLA
ncbi:MAG: TIGR01244 family phosphatase [Betaproteobacteria bacterium HGW-Betaproteobacteria-22]|nr:MAG: TIGR01244 family phosphatase [Betaproteobacteria bacterium HGW-Betaproteobacteria-22]